jgi:hypothetical protein
MNYQTHYYNGRWWIKANGRLIGGYSDNLLRSYVFPLYTPKGVLVLQESPADHPHHQGICIGLNIDGHDLWNAGSVDVPRNRIETLPALSEVKPTVSESNVILQHKARWLAVSGEELLLEQRSIKFRVSENCTIVEWRSDFCHSTKTSRIAQTKESGIGLRVPPHWETIFGGEIRNAEGAIGEKGCFDQLSKWLNIQSPSFGLEAGVIFIPTSETEKCPWFTRDYGLHVYNPFRHQSCELLPRQCFTWSVMVVAYDGIRTVEQNARLVDLIAESNV